jgi:hypothetical protein
MVLFQNPPKFSLPDVESKGFIASDRIYVQPDLCLSLVIQAYLVISDAAMTRNQQDFGEVGSRGRQMKRDREE